MCKILVLYPISLFLIPEYTFCIYAQKNAYPKMQMFSILAYRSKCIHVFRHMYVCPIENNAPWVQIREKKKTLHGYKLMWRVQEALHILHILLMQ